MEAKALLAQIVELAPTRDPRRALEVGEFEWREMAEREATAEDAETCRLLSISAAAVAEYAVADLWRERARTLAETVGWPELIAALDMSQAFKELSLKNDDYSRGRTLDVIEGSAPALDLIRNLDSVAQGPDSGIRVSKQSPTAALIRRFVLEKTGSFQLALNDWESAAESFAQAVEAAESPRGLVKSRGGLALARYIGGLGSSSAEAILQAEAETKAAFNEATSLDETDVAETARHNLEVMTRRGKDLLLYEIL